MRQDDPARRHGAALVSWPTDIIFTLFRQRAYCVFARIVTFRCLSASCGNNIMIRATRRIANVVDTLNRLISLLSFFLRSPRPGPALADQRHPGVRVGERDGAAAEGAEGDGERGGHDGGVVVADGGHGAAQERRHDLHLPRLQLQHDAGLEGGGHAADEP